jgi:hypothetical protein
VAGADQRGAEEGGGEVGGLSETKPIARAT